MSNYGVTDKGFVIKRMDKIVEEIHQDLTEGFGIDTRLRRPSFLDVLVTTFASQIADLWETAQNDYYSKYPSTAVGVNLDNAVQYGGIRRAANKRTSYMLHCTGDDGTYVREEAVVATNTKPEIRLFSASEFKITRESFNSVEVTVAVAKDGEYSLSINGEVFKYKNSGGLETEILNGLKTAITNKEYTTEVKNAKLIIVDTVKNRNNVLVLSDNLTTSSVTTIASFLTQDYGKITLPHGIVTKMINNITGFNSVTNLLDPIYGRLRETDIELRQSYIAKSALRSNTMIDSIISEILSNIENVESATGYENDTDLADERGLPPHSIEIIVEGGETNEIAQAILRKKAGGIQTHGSIVVNVAGNYGDAIPVKFNRPEYLYTWLKIVLHGDKSKIPANYAYLTKQSLIEYGSTLVAGSSLLTQLLTEGIYDSVSGITFIDISTAYSTDKEYKPNPSDYKVKNIMANTRQKILIDDTRIEVSFVEDT